MFTREGKFFELDNQERVTPLKRAQETERHDPFPASLPGVLK